MKVSILFLAALLCSILIFNSCGTVETYTVYVYKPIYQSYDELRKSYKFSESREMKEFGKIYVYKNYLFINEWYKGIHIFNNTNPSQPINIGFINLPGNNDISVKDNILYADTYVDLLAFDISDINNITISKTCTDVFKAPSYKAYNKNINYDNVIRPARFIDIDKSKGIIIGWEFVGSEEKKEYIGATDSDNSSGNSTGAAGSMSRFAIVGENLYSLHRENLQIYDIAEVANPKFFSQVTINFAIETIFPFNEHLLIGSQTGMFIYDISNPSAPQQISAFAHVTSCDPVVAQGNYAYVTLRGGTACGSTTNQLDILDISNMHAPQLITSHEMNRPAGLAIENDLLFICDSNAGLKVYNVNESFNLDLLFHDDTLETYDIILNNEKAIVVGPDAVYQYDYSDINNLKLLSKIETVPDEENSIE